MYCRKCGASIQDDANFCPKCGIAVEAAPDDAERHCWKCGARLQHDAEFCPNCGVTVPQWDDTHCSKCGALLADEANFCHVCGAVVTKQICCEPDAQKCPQPAKSANTDYREIHLPAAPDVKSSGGAPGKADAAPEKKPKAWLAEWKGIDRHSLGFVVFVLPLILALCCIGWMIAEAAISVFLTAALPEGLGVCMVGIHFGILYPCAIMRASENSKASKALIVCAKIVAFSFAGFFLFAVMFAILSEAMVSWIYGVLYIAAAVVAAHDAQIRAD